MHRPPSRILTTLIPTALCLLLPAVASDKTVWSAWTTEKVKDPQKPGKQIDKAVKKLLRRFPPP